MDNNKPDFKARVISDNKDWFNRSNYWGNSNRVLIRMGGKYREQVEVSVSPVNNFDGDWRDLALVRIRTHATVSKDHFSHAISPAIWNDLVEHVGEEIANILVHTDLLGEIDPDEHKKYQRTWSAGGGIPFILLAKDRSKFAVLLEPLFGLLDREPYYLKLMDDDILTHYEKSRVKSSEERLGDVNNVPREWLTHYAELLKEHGDSDTAERVLELTEG